MVMRLTAEHGKDVLVEWCCDVSMPKGSGERWRDRCRFEWNVGYMDISGGTDENVRRGLEKGKDSIEIYLCYKHNC